MAGFLDSLRKTMRPFDEDDEYIDDEEEEIEDDYYDEEEEDEEDVIEDVRAGSRRSASAPTAKRGFTQPRSSVSRERVEPAPRRQPEYSEPPRRVAPAPARSGGVRSFSPTSYEEVHDIAQNLRDRRVVILAVENTDSETVQRILDFLGGVTFALDGQIRRIARKVYAFIPNGVDFTGFALEDSGDDSEDMYF